MKPVVSLNETTSFKVGNKFGTSSFKILASVETTSFIRGTTIETFLGKSNKKKNKGIEI